MDEKFKKRKLSQSNAESDRNAKPRKRTGSHSDFEHSDEMRRRARSASLKIDNEGNNEENTTEPSETGSASTSTSTDRLSFGSNKTDFSDAKSVDVEKLLKVNIGQLRFDDRKLSADKLFGKLATVPDQLLNVCFDNLRESCQSMRVLEKDVDGVERVKDVKSIKEATMSSVIGSLLKSINSFVLNKLDLEVEELEVEPESPLHYERYKGRMDFAVFRTVEKVSAKGEPRNKKEYYFVVECKADDPLDGLKQAILYLARLRQLRPNAGPYFAIIAAGVFWHLVRFNGTYLVSERHQLVRWGMQKSLNKEALKEVKEEWKGNNSLMVKIIYSILKNNISKLQ